MVERGWRRIKRLYLIWIVISLILLYLIVQINLQQILIWIVIILFLKDIFIDLGAFNIFGARLPKKGPWPNWLEHAPFVALVALGGFFGILDISQLTIWIAVVDTIIDVLDDIGKI